MSHLKIAWLDSFLVRGLFLEVNEFLSLVLLLMVSDFGSDGVYQTVFWGCSAAVALLFSWFRICIFLVLFVLFVSSHRLN